MKKIEKKEKTETDNYSLRLRAEARALLEDSGRPPVIISEYVEPLFDADGNHIYGGKLCDSRTAKVNGSVLTRWENETLEKFRERACNAVPAMKTGIVEMQGDGAGEPPDGRQCRLSGDLAGENSRPSGGSDAEKDAGLRIISRILSGIWGLPDVALDFPGEQLDELRSRLCVAYGFGAASE